MHLDIAMRWRRVSTTLVLSAAAFALGTTPLVAQSSSTADRNDTDLCLGFSFGSWKPALDWALAGHKPGVDTSIYTKAAGGRDWAVSGTKSEGDTTFVLFPMWWPAGVAVYLERNPVGVADTVRGHAVALIADGTKTPPTSVIRAWAKGCHS